ncbi:MAG: bifunctional diaminohydroxyphosphoribosylaminopyrimidine deaminase/5-amino-6-(5-phosphoribosylamino)uracil reductase RibD, partial [Acidimicrobiales bacterium]
MAEALAVGAAARATTSPNPWVGCVLVPDDGRPACQAATEPPGGAHAEIGALELAGEAARGATVYVTLEPC